MRFFLLNLIPLIIISYFYFANNFNFLYFSFLALIRIRFFSRSRFLLLSFCPLFFSFFFYNLFLILINLSSLRISELLNLHWSFHKALSAVFCRFRVLNVEYLKENKLQCLNCFDWFVEFCLLEGILWILFLSNFFSFWEE